MSFIISVYLREGIVMAADSRLTLTIDSKQAELLPPTKISVPSTDSNNKLFVSKTGIGIATYGAAGIGAEPLASVIDEFLESSVVDPALGPEEVARALLQKLRAFPNQPDSFFHVCGYKTEEGRRVQHVWSVSVRADSVSRVNSTGVPGAAWGGESETMSRLFGSMFTQPIPGRFEPLPATPLAWEFFTLQDGIDFAAFAVRATINFIRFLPRPQTVGGPIDVLLIRPTESRWISVKTLKFPT